MRRATSLVVAAVLVLGLVPNLVFTLGCIAGGCGDASLRAPDQLEVTAYPPNPRPEAPGPSDTAEATGATADPAPLATACAEAPPALALTGLDLAPLPDEITLAYTRRRDCSVPEAEWPTVYVRVAPAGLVPGLLDVTWTFTLDGETWTGEDQWTVPCLDDGTLDPGGIRFALPKEADGEEVTLAVTLADAEGTEVSARHTFLAHVSED